MASWNQVKTILFWHMCLCMNVYVWDCCSHSCSHQPVLSHLTEGPRWAVTKVIMEYKSRRKICNAPADSSGTDGQSTICNSLWWYSWTDGWPSAYFLQGERIQFTYTLPKVTLWPLIDKKPRRKCYAQNHLLHWNCLLYNKVKKTTKHIIQRFTSFSLSVIVLSSMSLIMY